MRGDWILLGALSSFLGIAGCSATPQDGGGLGGGPGAGGGSPPVGGGPGAGGVVNGAGGYGTGNEPSFGGFGALPGEDGPDGSCSAVSQRAEQSMGRADIVWIVDNSGSMTEEAAAVQSNLNTFSQQIAATGIDVHVVLISSGIVPLCLPGICLVNGICLDPPLGAPGACPSGDDTNIAAGYMHWNVNVSSWDGLAQIQSTFSGWRGMLRPDAKKTFVIVTDDNAQPVPTVQEFSSWVDAQPEFQSGWRFSGVFCFGVAANCSSPGAAYTQLVTQTGGISVDLGTPNIDWQPVFTQLADAVVQEARPVDCEWAIPPPPEGETLDPELVNVKFTPSSGQPQTIYFRDGVAACTEDTGGWYYDDPVNPSTVRACPTSCAVMQADLGGRVDVQFGCLRETEPIQ